MPEAGQETEALVVIMVLGGDTDGSGARNWAVSEPNLLNVAATRAKRRFYVIGDRNDWKNRSLFCGVIDLLPLQSISTRQQEEIIALSIAAYCVAEGDVREAGGGHSTTRWKVADTSLEASPTLWN